MVDLLLDFKHNTLPWFWQHILLSWRQYVVDERYNGNCQIFGLTYMFTITQFDDAYLKYNLLSDQYREKATVLLEFTDESRLVVGHENHNVSFQTEFPRLKGVLAQFFFSLLARVKVFFWAEMRKRRKKQVTKKLPCASDVGCHAGSATASKGNQGLTSFFLQQEKKYRDQNRSQNPNQNPIQNRSLKRNQKNLNSTPSSHSKQVTL